MKHHGRSIYGCGAATAEFVTPTDCRYTGNAQTRRHYLQMLAWPLHAIHLQGLA
jgi:alpha-L-fucosidase